MSQQDIAICARLAKLQPNVSLIENDLCILNQKTEGTLMSLSGVTQR